MLSPKPFRALTIAGFDPSGGAGVLADTRTFAAFGLQGTAAITSITFQNPAAFLGAAHQTGRVVRAQISPLLDRFTLKCAKTGMLPTSEVVREVAQLFRETDLPRPVVDPVINSSSGYSLMEEGALPVLIAELLPLAALLTPNIPEAETLAGITIDSEADMRRAAAIIRKMGTTAVLIKGGHLKRQKADSESTSETPGHEEEAVDLLDNGGTVTVFREKLIPGAQLHGSGCILSAAIAAGLGNGSSLEDAVAAAKSFVLIAIRSSIRLG